MEKQVIISLSEYERLIETIEEQKNIINTFKKEPNIVLIDERRSDYRRDINVHVPYIVATDPNKAKEYLQDEFKQLESTLYEINQTLAAKRKESEHNKKRSWLF